MRMVFPDKVIQFLTGGFNKNTINLSDFIIENVITLCIGCIFSGALRTPILTCKIPAASAKNIHFYAIFQAKILKTGPQFPKFSPPAVLFPAKIFQMFVLAVLFPPKNLRMFVWGVLTRGGFKSDTPVLHWL